jgi:hypothetical protein
MPFFYFSSCQEYTVESRRAREDLLYIGQSSVEVSPPQSRPPVAPPLCWLSRWQSLRVRRSCDDERQSALSIHIRPLSQDVGLKCQAERDLGRLVDGHSESSSSFLGSSFRCKNFTKTEVSTSITIERNSLQPVFPPNLMCISKTTLDILDILDSTKEKSSRS